ncbi:hypothetical protein JJQ72_12775 [Paenibacillus sp. F411]|uniref:DUF6470 family protein n=1 Tax=Paenibacillus sp. F411 TaxID=2820239 RepID=UPI001AAF6AC3|nr:DUF6470 family protein [Paenibacillus sp. F411]MBO2944846.1 hypothetical protein [Paenibacillus sp. F411]
MNLLRLSIRQTYGSIGIETKNAVLNLNSPHGQLEVQSNPSTISINSRKGQLEVDSSKAWMALGKGNHQEWLSLISGQMHQEFLLNVSRIVEEGNQLAQFKKTTIADMMRNRVQEESSLDYVGDASTMNVDLRYHPGQAEVDWDPHVVEIQYTPQKVQSSYEPGKVEVYLQQKNSLNMWVSHYNIYV